jgi:methylenetetrahydrofolate reductase (NADPH)
MNLTANHAEAVAVADDTATVERRLLSALSIEATAVQIEASGDLAASLPPGTSVYVPFLPGMAFADMVGACRRLVAMGLQPIPHLAARRLGGRAELDDALPRFVDAGVDAMLLIAGDEPRPHGEFTDTVQVLDTGLLERHGIRRLGVAGHPEGHPVVEAGQLAQALRVKADYARTTGTEMWLVSQFVFDAAPLMDWDAALAAAGIDLPVTVGLPGPAKVRTLIAFAMRCGISASARSLAQHASALKLLGGWTPDTLIHDLADYRAGKPDSRIGGIHIFTFGGLAPSLDWVRGLFGAQCDSTGRMEQLVST